jgi:uncharacterized OsmC-like protein
MSLSNFSITGNSVNSTLYQGQSRQFNFLVDEPEALGGQDLAANPVEYLLAGYAGCLNVVINLVAKELGIKLDAIHITIDGDIDASTLLGANDKARAGFQSLHVVLDLTTDAPQEQIDSLLSQVKNRCPISDNLSQVTPIHYEVQTYTTQEEIHA